MVSSIGWWIFGGDSAEIQIILNVLKREPLGLGYADIDEYRTGESGSGEEIKYPLNADRFASHLIDLRDDDSHGSSVHRQQHSGRGLDVSGKKFADHGVRYALEAGDEADVINDYTEKRHPGEPVRVVVDALQMKEHSLGGQRERSQYRREHENRTSSGRIDAEEHTDTGDYRNGADYYDGQFVPAGQAGALEDQTAVRQNRYVAAELLNGQQAEGYFDGSAMTPRSKELGDAESVATLQLVGDVRLQSRYFLVDVRSSAQPSKRGVSLLAVTCRQ